MRRHGLQQNLARNGRRHQRLQSRGFESAGDGIDEQEREDKPDRTIGKRRQQQQRDRDNKLNDIAIDENEFAAGTIDDLPGDQRKRERRQELHQPDQAERHGTPGEIVDQPADRDRLHLVGSIGGSACGEQKPERAMMKQRCD